MANYPAHGTPNWDDDLKAYIDGAINEALIDAGVIDAPPGPGTSAPGLYIPSNFERTGLNAGLAARSAGSRDLQYVGIGDSTEYGYAAGTTPDVDRFVADYPLSKMVALTQATALAPVGEGIVRPIDQQFHYADPRWTFGTGWGQPGSPGQGAQAAAGASGALGFTPGYAGNSVTVVYAQNSGQGTYTVRVGGAVVGTINAAGSNEIKTATFTFARSTNPVITVTGVTGGSAFVYGIGVSDSTARAIRITNMGQPAAQINDFVANPFTSVASQAEALDADVVEINLTINDSTNKGNGNGYTPVETWSGRMVTLIERWQGAGASVILIMGLPSISPIAGIDIVALQETYAVEMRRLADLYGCAFLDLRAGVGGTYAAGLTSGYFNEGDGLHASVSGYVKGAEQRRDLLVSLAA